MDSKPVRIDEELISVIREYSDGSISDGIREMDARIKGSPRKRQIETVEDIEAAVRKVTQVEGVMLHARQKGFFQELFASLMNYWAGQDIRKKGE